MLRYDGRLYTPSACPHIVPARPCYHGRESGAKLSVLIAVFLSTVWLRRIFIAAVLGLAVKQLLPLH